MKALEMTIVSKFSIASFFASQKSSAFLSISIKSLSIFARAVIPALMCFRTILLHSVTEFELSMSEIFETHILRQKKFRKMFFSHRRNKPCWLGTPFFRCYYLRLVL